MRAVRIFVLLGSLLLLAPIGGALGPVGLPIGATGHDVFLDDFRTLNNWTLVGSASTSACCDDVYANGHLSMTPACCDTYRDVVQQRAIHTKQHITVSVSFRGSTTSGDTDAVFEFIQANGENIVLTTTEGAGFSNNGVRVFHGNANTGQIESDTGSFATWSAGQWYQARIHVATGAGIAWAEVRDANDQLVARSKPIVVGSGFGDIATLRFRTITYGPTAIGTYDWDTLAVVQEDGPSGAP